MLNPFALRQSRESIEAFKLLSTKGKQINKRQTEGREGGRERGQGAGKQMCLQMSQVCRAGGSSQGCRRTHRLSNDPWQPEGNVSQAQMINTLEARITGEVRGGAA